MPLSDHLINVIKNDSTLSPSFTVWDHSRESKGSFLELEGEKKKATQIILDKIGFPQLYAHQAEAIDFINAGENVAIVTGTASGKSLCYQIPIIEKYEKTGSATALLIFPTKALTYDQLNAFNNLLAVVMPETIGKQIAAVYDGDTPTAQRPFIRKNSKILLSNPDMLNIALLPYHTNWATFFQNLQFVVIDELHLYRGVFGSHFANIIRRLKRILEFYGSSPQYILTSATIGNPKELAEKIIEQPVTLVSKDDSPKGDRHFVFYNPPLVVPEYGIREGLLTSTTKIASFLVEKKIQTIVFCKSRKFVELVVRDLRLKYPLLSEKIRGYRSGYLKNQRREIEKGLKNQSILLVAATNALELGVDIGGVDAVLIAGYPGSISSIKQMSGRAGRKQAPSISMLIASMNPLDQYFSRYPEELFKKPIEQALIDPNNPLILIPHLKSAAFELPITNTASFGSLEPEKLRDYWGYLVEEGSVQLKNNKYFWLSDAFPSNDISIRSVATSSIILQVNDDGKYSTIGEVDFNSALWMVHPGAVYLHDGDQYHVDSLDLEKQIGQLSPFSSSFTTEPIRSLDIEIVNEQKEKNMEYVDLKFGEIEVKSQVSAYKKIDSQTREVLSTESLEMPVTSLDTAGFWIILNEKCIQKMKSENMWFGDANDYGEEWNIIRQLVLERDNFTCKICGLNQKNLNLHVHHKIPFKSFTSLEQANSLENLVTLCPDCHRLAEMNVRIRNSLSGLRYVISNMAPLLVLCDVRDLDSYSEPQAKFEELKPVVLIHDTTPAGIGLSESLYERFSLLIDKCFDLVSTCKCASGCPSCVGPDSENGFGGKKETLFLLSLIKDG